MAGWDGNVATWVSRTQGLGWSSTAPFMPPPRQVSPYWQVPLAYCKVAWDETCAVGHVLHPRTTQGNSGRLDLAHAADRRRQFLEVVKLIVNVNCGWEGRERWALDTLTHCFELDTWRRITLAHSQLSPIHTLANDAVPT